jgi:hypothetical protein
MQRMQMFRRSYSRVRVLVKGVFKLIMLLARKEKKKLVLSQFLRHAGSAKIRSCSVLRLVADEQVVQVVLA